MRFLLTLIAIAAILWSGALAWFIHSIPAQRLDEAVHADALVVLTGGQGRVEHGLDMLGEGAAPVLFISGVGKRVSESEIMDAHATAETREKIYENDREIVLDHVARSTVSNADQAASFIKKRRIQSIRLITASYHMKRSLKEFSLVMPDVQIIPDPVFPAGFKRDEWWQHENTRRLIFSEFYKYFAVLLRDWMQPSPNAANG